MSDSNTTEQNLNDPRPQDYEKDGKVDDDFIPDDGRPVCPRCLKPCHPLQHYCNNCDSNDAINPLTPYMAFVNIRFNYGIFITMWRKTWYDKDTPIMTRLVYLFITAWFTPILLIIGLPLFLIGKAQKPLVRQTARAALYVIVIILLVVLLFYLLSGGRVASPYR